MRFKAKSIIHLFKLLIMKYLRFISKTIGQTFSALALTLLLPLNSTLAQGTWTQKSDMPFFKNHHSAVAYNGKIYLLGGGADLSACTNEVWEYDPVADTFIAKAPMPIALCGAATVEADGKIYLFGGYTTFGGLVSDAALEYDVTNNTWKTLAPMPTARGYASANFLSSISFGNKIAVFGGGTAFLASVLDTMVFYGPSTNTWTAGPTLTGFARGGHTTHNSNFGIGFLIFGGVSGPATPAEDSILFFDILGGWGPLGTMIVPRVFHGSAAIDDKVFVMGGMDAMGGPVHASAEMIKMSLAPISTVPVASMLTARRAHAAAAVDKKVYVFGGNNESGVLKSVEVFDPGNLVAASEPFAASGAELLQNTPNPFGDETLISFSLAVPAQVELAVFDLSGRKRATLVNQSLSPGTYTQRLSAGELETGFYYYRLLLDGFKPAVREMVVVK